MPHMPSRIALLALLALLAAPAARADDDDHERARAALQAGRVLPIETILAAARAQFGGDVLDAELEDEHGAFVYEIKLMTADGRILKLDYDAATGVLLRQRQRPRDR